MTARTGMNNLIAQLRAMCNAGTADYTVSGVSMWTDLQLQNILDLNRSDYYEKPIYPVEEYIGGVITRYYLGDHNVESGTAVFSIKDAAGAKKAETTDYTVDYSLGLVTFNADTLGVNYYATYRAYDLNSAAAAVWRQKAAHYADMYTFKAGNQSVNKSDLIAQALQMAAYYSQQAGARSISIERSDTW